MRTIARARGQRGQALVFGILWLVPLLVLLVALYATVQYTTAKAELQNAADASALSLATVAARDYNFSAYMNRAMVANQVAAAQFVGVASWITFAGRVITNLVYVCDFFPEVAGFCNALKANYDRFKKVYVEDVWPHITQALSYWLVALSDLQLAFHAGTAEALWRNLGLPEPGLDPGVLALNDPKARAVQWPDAKKDVPREIFQLALLLDDAYGWWTHTRRHAQGDAGDAMARFGDVTNRSLDGFGRSRNWDTPQVSTSDLNRILDFLPEWARRIIRGFLGAWKIAWIEPQIKASLRRRGATLIKYQEGRAAWTGLDTMEEENEVTVKGCYKFPPVVGKTHCFNLFGPITVPVPVGWGWAIATSPEGKGKEADAIKAGDSSYAGAKKDTWAAYYAATLLQTDVSEDYTYKGLSPYYDVSDERRGGSDKAATFTLLLSKRSSDIAGFAGSLYDGSATGTRRSVGLPATECAAQIYALARARVVYAREEKYSSLFTPFWEAALADPGDRTKVLALVSARGASLEGGGCTARLLPW